MKIKILGLTVFEIERDPRPRHPAPNRMRLVQSSGPEISVAPPSPATRALADLCKPEEILPRSPKGTIDVQASLREFGITDPAPLWSRKYPGGSAGASLKRVLGAKGLKPTGLLPTPARRSGSGVGAAQDRERLVALSDLPPAQVPAPAGIDRDSVPHNADARGLVRDSAGRIDIQRSLKALDLADARLLWQEEVERGSAAHELKKEIARVLARGEAVCGLTRRDIGLTN
jgi:hypothetical protein